MFIAKLSRNLEKDNGKLQRIIRNYKLHVKARGPTWYHMQMFSYPIAGKQRKQRARVMRLIVSSWALNQGISATSRLGKNKTLPSWMGTVILMSPKNLESSSFFWVFEPAEVTHFLIRARIPLLKNDAKATLPYPQQDGGPPSPFLAQSQ